VELGLCYSKGQGVELNDSKAFLLWKRAAEQDQPAALFNVGLCYANGIGTNPDLAQALFWLKLSSQLYTKEKTKEKAEKVIAEVIKKLTNEQISDVDQKIKSRNLSRKSVPVISHNPYGYIEG
jgi:hypothetical protein